MRRNINRRFYGKDLEQALRGAGSRRDLATNFRQRTQRTGGEHGIEDELAEPARRQFSVEHVMRADPKHDDHARRNEENRKGGENRARADRMARRFEGALDRVAK